LVGLFLVGRVSDRTGGVGDYLLVLAAGEAAVMLSVVLVLVAFALAVCGVVTLFCTWEEVRMRGGHR
jgi:hypothetical protein